MKATIVSPWMDMLRHRYEGGASIADLRRRFNATRHQVVCWLMMAGTKFRGPKAVRRARRRMAGK